MISFHSGETARLQVLLAPSPAPQDRLQIPAAAKVLQFGRSKSLPTMPHIRQLAAVLQLCQYSLLTVITATLK